MSNDLDNYTQDPYAKGMLEDALEGMDSLLKAAETDHAVIKERVFKRILLPVLTNRSGKQSLRIWQDIAGHPMRAIEVQDDRTGERLFIIPPLLKGILPSINRNQKRMSIYEVLQTAEQKRRVIPGMGDRFLVEHMQQWTPEGSNDDSTLRQWAAILTRYNIDIGIAPASDEERATEDTQSPGVDLTGEYDDL